MGDKNKQNKPKKTLKEKRMEKHQKYEHTSDAVVKQTVLKSIDKSRFLQILIYIGIYRGRLFFDLENCIPPKIRFYQKPTKTSKERKLKLKKIRSEIKKNLGKIW